MATAKTTTRTNRTVNFTETWLKGKKPFSAPNWADKACPGLRIRTSKKTGLITFEYRCRFNGEIFKRKIDKYDPETFTLQDARDAWRELSLLRQKGINPATYFETEKEHPAELEQAEQETATLARLVKEYVAVISRDRKSWAKTASILSTHLKPYMTRQADTLTRGDVLTVLQGLRDAGKPVMHNRCKAAIHSMFNWAIGAHWQEGVIKYNPAFQIKHIKEQPRQRALSDKELRTVLNKLPESGLSDAVQDLLVFTLLTGVRIGEACSMQWKHIHDDEWRLPAELTKNGRAHTVYLSPPAQAIINKYPGGAYVFENPKSHTGHIRRDSVEWMLRRALGVDVKVAKADRVNSLGVEPFTPHDMRRSLATWLGENQVSEKVHDRMLNHYKQTIAAVYNTAKYNKPAREWWTKWGEHIQALSADNVVPLWVNNNGL